MTTTVSPMIEAVTDAAELARVYDEVLEPSFPETELVTADEFIASGAAGDLDVLVARADDGGIRGVIVGERHGTGILVNWLAVSGTTRRGGMPLLVGILACLRGSGCPGRLANSKKSTRSA